MPDWYDYVLYGLQIETNAPIYGLTHTVIRERADVTIYSGAIPVELAADSLEWVAPHQFRVTQDAPANAAQQYLREWRDGGYLELTYEGQITVVFALDGSRVWVSWSTSIDEPLRAFNVMGPMMGIVLRLRGITPLHASVIAIEGQAVAFVGASGSGKSTLAAAFDQLGYPILSDDLCVLTFTDTGVMIPPGSPRIRLLADAAQALYGEMVPYEVSPHRGDKREYAVEWKTAQASPLGLPLAAIYFLEGRSDAIVITPMSERDALFKLLREVYTRHITTIYNDAVAFQDISMLVKHIPAYSLISEQGHNTLKKLCHMIAMRHS